MDRIERQEPPNVLLSATRLLYHMGKIFQSSAPAPQSCGVQIDRKRLAKLRRMRIAAGHKADDHEQEQSSSTMSMGWYGSTDDPGDTGGAGSRSRCDRPTSEYDRRGT